MTFPVSNPVNLPPAFRRGRVWAALLAAAFLAACTQTKSFVHDDIGEDDELAERTETVRVLLMPLDIELYEITAGGLAEPKAEWTNRARGHVTEALRAALGERKADLVSYEAPSDDASKEDSHLQLVKLHGEVGQTILTYKYGPGEGLPTKKDKFDWTLGTGVRALAGEYATDSALFIFLRDSTSSAGRMALIAIGALFNPLRALFSGGRQIGFASLVDLDSGDILWFNTLVSTVGDLREPEPARSAVDLLLADMPL